MAANRSGAGRELRGLIAMVVLLAVMVVAAKTGLLAAGATWFGEFFGDKLISGLTDATTSP